MSGAGSDDVECLGECAEGGGDEVLGGGGEGGEGGEGGGQ